jgi:hypothetical protein
MDPDPAIFVVGLQKANKKLMFLKKISAYYFLRYSTVHMIKGSGSGRPKIMWIRWIRIRIRIRKLQRKPQALKQCSGSSAFLLRIRTTELMIRIRILQPSREILKI